MEIILYTIIPIVLAYYLWLSFLATIAVRYDRTLNSFQKKAQTVIIWLVPVFGAVLMLYLTWQHYPDAIPKTWIPWPFKKAIYKNYLDRTSDPGTAGEDTCSMTDVYTSHQRSHSDADAGGGD